MARNLLRLALHLNVTQCALKTERWDEAITHATRALEIDRRNAKAIYRRALAHFQKPEHSNGISLAKEVPPPHPPPTRPLHPPPLPLHYPPPPVPPPPKDLLRARQLEPRNREVSRFFFFG